MTKKLIIFELDTTVRGLKSFYHKKSTGNAYYDIRKVMHKNKFLWQGGSVYLSTFPLSYHQVSLLIEELYEDNDWIEKCLRDYLVIEIDNFHRLSNKLTKKINKT